MTTDLRANKSELAARMAGTANAIRRISIASIYHATSGHPGGALSAADLLACIYGAALRSGDDFSRDRFVLSKGHSAPALYATGAQFGLCSIKDALSLRKLGSKFQGHPHVAELPWVETSTGSLGQGFSVAIGMGLGLKMKKSPARVYTMLGDGELQEGEVWEGAMFAAHHKLDNLIAILDYNKLQSDDSNANIMGLEPLGEKWRSFGWQVQEIDGHNISLILDALEKAAMRNSRPHMIIAHTVKGRGVPYMENIPLWHGSVKLTAEQTRAALRALGTAENELDKWINGDV
ncbi:MAG TPA: transketolase [Rhizomicrobium sp.]|nr:transketolase [Rhizomicrobium sp.]